MKLLRYILRRLARVVVVVVGLVAVTFFLTRAVSDPVDIILGADATREQRAQLNRELGLDQPLVAQFGDYVGDLAEGDLGVSLWLGQPALDLILYRLPASLLLASLGIGVAIVLGLALGISGGLRPGSYVDRITIGLSAFALAVPDFWLGILFIIVFAVELGWFPTGGYEGLELRYLVLPTLTVALLPAGRLARVAREAVVEEMGKQYVVAARARGLRTRQIVGRHLLKNIAVATGTVAGYDFLVVFTGALATVEVVFGWPGVGRLAVLATLQEDVVLMSALVIVTGLIIGIGNIVLDMIFAAIDRRMTS